MTGPTMSYSGILPMQLRESHEKFPSRLSPITKTVPSDTLVSTSPEVGDFGSFLLTVVSGLKPFGCSLL